MSRAHCCPVGIICCSGYIMIHYYVLTLNLLDGCFCNNNFSDLLLHYEMVVWNLLQNSFNCCQLDLER